MTKYRYVEPDENNEPAIYTVNKTEIIHNFFPYWSEKMIKKYGKDHHLITKENCIEDWIALNFAWKV